MYKGLLNKLLLILGFILITGIGIQAQNPSYLDSLETVYDNGRYSPDEELSLLAKLAVNHHSNADKKLFFSQALITASETQEAFDLLITAYVEQGTAYGLKSDMDESLESYITAAEYAAKYDEQKKLGGIYITIADVLSVIDNHEEAISYYKDGIDILKSENDSVNLASAYLNLGDEFFIREKFDSALVYTQLSEILFSDLDHRIGLAYSLGNKGMIYAKMNQDLAAENEMNKAMGLMENQGVFEPIATYLIHLSDIFLKNKDTDRALRYAQKSLAIAKEHGFKEQMSDATFQIHEIYEELNNIALSFEYYKEHIRYRDSVMNFANVQEMADIRSDFEVSQKQIEVDLLNQEKKNKELVNKAMKIILGLISIILLTLFWFYKSISKEKKRADNLLLNILPDETASELKSTGKVKAKRFDSVSVLFADFKGFTSYSSTLSPEDLVKSLDLYFSKFDELVGKYHLEKIKTIGDAYMCSGGLPFVTDDHAIKIVRLALDMVKFTKMELESENIQNQFDIRIGVNTGPVVAGVVGFKKFAYDIWGDTVNIASRMESNSIPGRVNISQTTYELVKDHFDCEARGEIDVKNKGLMQMYFVNGAKN